nr:MAG TPA: hypothetical protein [Caudoviricetes sp.]
MEDKLKQANDNMEILVKEIVKLRKERDRSYCVHPQEKFDNENFCDNNCDECQIKYYENMKEYLLKKYQVESK